MADFFHIFSQFSHDGEIFKENLRKYILYSGTDSLPAISPATLAEKEHSLKQWFDPLRFELSPAGITIVFPHAFFASWFADKGQATLEKSLKGMTESLIPVTYLAGTKSIIFSDTNKPDTNKKDAKEEPAFPFEHKQEHITPVFSYMRYEHNFAKSPAGPDKTSFDSFMASIKNKPVLDMLQSITCDANHANNASHGEKNTPRHKVPFSEAPRVILLRGASGTGKTHLLQVMANAQISRHKKPVCYIGAAGFADLVHAPRHEGSGSQGQALASFHHNCRECSAFYIDDIPALAHDVRSQEALVAIIDMFVADQKPVIATASSDPLPTVPVEKQHSLMAMPSTSPLAEGQRAYQHDNIPKKDGYDRLSALVPALLSRLCMGMILELNSPDIDVKMRYAQYLLSYHSLPQNRDIALILARRCSDFRQIQGITTQVAAFHAFSGQLPDEDVLDNIFRSSGKPRSITPDAILSVVASRYGYSSKDLKGRKRDPKLVLARQIAMYLCRELLGESYPSLGRIFGNKDHSTVIHAVKKIKKNQLENKDMNIQLAELTQSCRRRFS